MRKSNRMDISGQKYNCLTALNFHETDRHGNSIWKCLCDCGEFAYVRLGALRAGQIKRCKKCADKAKTKLFIKNPRIKSIYRDMIRRCYKPNRKNYDNYGGRGIRVCDEWLDSPLSFEQWSLENGYSNELSIDRIDNDGNYEPSNCRWTNDKVQQNNRSNNNVLEYNGKSLTITQWSEKLGVDRTTIYNRIKNGESPDVIFSPIDIRQQKSKSGIKGIHWRAIDSKWTVRVVERGKRIYVGSYKCMDNAIFAKEKYEKSKEKLTEEEILRQLNK